MAESANERLFRTKVRPIMDKVMADLRNKQLEEIGRHTSSLPYIFAGAAGPDGGMSAQAASIASLRYTGEWNSNSEVIHRLYHQKGGHQHHLLLATGIEQIAFGESYLRTGRKAIQSQPCGKSSRSYVGSHS